MELTRESILAMQPGREMDALVAECVMGWSDERPRYSQYIKVDGNDIRAWEPSTDIAAAWEVIDSPQLARYRFGVLMTELGLWECRSFSPGYGIKVQSFTAQDAICRAALLSTLE